MTKDMSVTLGEHLANRAAGHPEPSRLNWQRLSVYAVANGAVWVGFILLGWAFFTTGGSVFIGAGLIGLAVIWAALAIWGTPQRGQFRSRPSSPIASPRYTTGTALRRYPTAPKIMRRSMRGFMRSICSSRLMLLAKKIHGRRPRIVAGGGVWLRHADAHPDGGLDHHGCRGCGGHRFDRPQKIALVPALVPPEPLFGVGVDAGL